MNNTTTFRHPHSPKSTTPTAASATIMDRAVSSRRSAAPYSSDAEPLTCASPIRVAEAAAVDESKTKRQHLSLLASNYLSRIANSPCLVLCIVTALVVISLAFHSRSLVCVSPYDPVSRIGPGLLRPDALESDFGYLGVPWCRSKHGKTVDWTSKDLLKALEEFVPIYETRPIKNNMYGMGFDHSFGLWFITRWLKPDLVIESGAFKGHSTWVLRQAMPDKRIISLSPRHPGKYLQKGPAYVDANCTYYAGKEFVDFGSVDWESVMNKHGISDLSREVVIAALKQGFELEERNSGRRQWMYKNYVDSETWWGVKRRNAK
ncbi:hypothetical protein Q3G72_011337 [Acer saccharum]|nr:hypothetical protein Q3G72_011337 [Acer saccharum]